ncbi:MAG: RsmD family RNA methyltransferase [Saprospiraceae bacterium]|nr:RsmD family RNA methyltransferase [Saprospiraceae bacterium]
MRISSGFLKGRTFYPPADNWPTRPTTDIARTGLFNILTNELNFEIIKVLDLFGGTGAHSYEFISRGCHSVTYVDKFVPAVKFAKQKAKEFDIEDKIEIIHRDYLMYIQKCTQSYDYIFAGPPYGLKELNLIPDQILNSTILNKDGLFVMEHNPDHFFEDHSNFIKKRNYGQTIFSFFKHGLKEETLND